jgi:membrane-associated phospholipid phosphatase
MLWVSRGMGLVTISHTLVLMCLPRLDMGIHDPIDMVGSAAIGAAMAWIVQRDALKT